MFHYRSGVPTTGVLFRVFQTQDPKEKPVGDCLCSHCTFFFILPPWPGDQNRVARLISVLSRKVASCPG